MKSKVCLLGVLFLLLATTIVGCSNEPKSSSDDTSVVGTWIYTGSSSDSPWFTKIVLTEETFKGYDKDGYLYGQGTYIFDGTSKITANVRVEGIPYGIDYYLSGNTLSDDAGNTYKRK